MSFKVPQNLIFALRMILAVLFIASALGKMVNLERYSVDAVYNFGILPMVLARPFGLILPFLELLCAGGLLFGILTRLSALGIGLMSLSFFIAKAYVLLQGRNIECGCFGAIIDTLSSLTIYLDVLVMGMAILILGADPRQRHWILVGQWFPRNWQKKLDLTWGNVVSNPRDTENPPKPPEDSRT
jgi:uncharacterized membrane protein YphA (DoxX/SURF4 family)